MSEAQMSADIEALMARPVQSDSHILCGEFADNAGIFSVLDPRRWSQDHVAESCQRCAC